MDVIFIIISPFCSYFPDTEWVSDPYKIYIHIYIYILKIRFRCVVISWE